MRFGFIAIPTAYEWIRRWNSEGVEGLRRKKIPGRPPKLPTEELEDLRRVKKGDLGNVHKAH